MFCSATPTLKNRLGKRSAKGSTTVKPRSAVNRTMRSSSSASSTSVRTNAPLIPHPHARRTPGQSPDVLTSAPTSGASSRHLREREPVLLVVERQVVPFDPARHERDAVAELGAGDDDARC